MGIKFFTQSGWLTRYALACGYKHSQKCGDGQEVELSCINSELPCYLVRRYKGSEKTFESYSNDLRTARHMFRKAVGKPLSKRYEAATDVRRLVFD